MTVKVKVIDRDRQRIESRLALLGEQRLLAGVQGAKAARIHRKSGGATVGEVAKFVQFGTETHLARPVFDLAVADIRQTARAVIQKVARQVVSKRRSAVFDAWAPLGQLAAGAVRDAFDRVGAVDTGETRDSVTYTVRFGGRILREGGPRR